MPLRGWPGSSTHGVPTREQGIKVLGTPLGHDDFVAAHLESVLAEHQILLTRIPLVKDVQSAWLLLLHCASVRACFQIRVVRPSAASQFAESHNGTLWQCLSNILQIDLNQCDEVVRDVATLPLSMGGLGLRSAVRVRSPGYWASCADCLPMMQARHPRVVAEILAEVGDRSASLCLEEARRAAWDLFGVMGSNHHHGTLW